MFDHLTNFYNLLEANAAEETIDGVRCLLFRGKIVELFSKLEISQGYYGPVNKALREMGCITLLRRGARSVDSVIVLHHAPDATEWLLRQDSDMHLTGAPEDAILRERLERMEARLGGLDIVEAFADMEKRLQELEALVAEERREAYGTK